MISVRPRDAAVASGLQVVEERAGQHAIKAAVRVRHCVGQRLIEVDGRARSSIGLAQSHELKFEQNFAAFADRVKTGQ